MREPGTLGGMLQTPAGRNVALHEGRVSRAAPRTAPRAAPTIGVGSVKQVDACCSHQVEHLLQLWVPALVIVPQQLVALPGQRAEKTMGASCCQPERAAAPTGRGQGMKGWTGSDRSQVAPVLHGNKQHLGSPEERAQERAAVVWPLTQLHVPKPMGDALKGPICTISLGRYSGLSTKPPGSCCCGSARRNNVWKKAAGGWAPRLRRCCACGPRRLGWPSCDCNAKECMCGMLAAGIGAIRRRGDRGRDGSAGSERLNGHNSVFPN